MAKNLKSVLRQTLYYSVGIVVVGFIFVILVDQLLMPSYTRHGRGQTVPDVTKMSLPEARAVLERSGLRDSLLDQRYNADLPPEFVVDQSPEPGSIVKPNRMIYLTINTTSRPQVTVPETRNLSLRNAELQLRNYGLSVGEIRYVSSLFKNSVVEQSIAPGSQVDRGTPVDLVVSDGLGQNMVDLPQLVGLPLVEAQLMLRERNLRIGSVLYQASNRYPADYILSMKPDDVDSLQEGSLIDLILSRALNAQEEDESRPINVLPPDTTRFKR
jgi:eukaryotic-like serine/threonine-protein kinase